MTTSLSTSRVQKCALAGQRSVTDHSPEAAPYPVTSPATILPQPNERDKAAVAQARRRVLDRSKRASVKVSTDGLVAKIDSPHADEAGHKYQMLDAFGTASNDFMATAFGQLLDAIREGDSTPPDGAVNAALALVGGVGPDNEVEALLATQMAATHALTMSLIGRARRSDGDAMTTYCNLASKMARTFSLQTEALSKLKRGGEQTVRVEHVHVHAGGRAIVGNVAAGGAPIENRG